MEVMVMDEFVGGSMIGMGDMSYSDGMYDMTEETQQVSKVDELLSSRLFVGGVTAAVFALGVLFGILAAKQKIKKDKDLYED